MQSRNKYSTLVGIMVVWTLLACSCSGSTSPKSAREDAPAAVSATPTATLSSRTLARITTVPKTTPSGAASAQVAEPNAVQPTVTLTTETVRARKIQVATPTIVFDASVQTSTLTPVATDAPTATASQSVVDDGSKELTPTVTPQPNPTATPTETPTPSPTTAVTPAPTVPGSTPTPTPTSPAPTATPTVTPEPEDDDSPPTITPTFVPDDIPDGWSFSNLAHEHTLQGETNFLHIWGEVFNNTGEDQYLTTIAARVYDQGGTLIADDYNTASIVPVNTLVQGRKVPFELDIILPDREFDPDRLTFELYLETRPAWYETREDLVILDQSWTVTDGAYEITGVVKNGGLALTSFVEVIATLYDGEGQVVGVGWFNETAPAYLKPGANEFSILLEDVSFEAVSYELQALGR